jgi:hypothetical protein
MAKSWSGFLPQNQNVLEQWGMLEASTHQIVDVLKALPKKEKVEPNDSLDQGEISAGWPYDAD